jgi:RNA polymerase sigma-70 factor, ECF subfamily
VRLSWVATCRFASHTGGMTRSDRPIAAPSFEDVVVPHLVAARRLARWLTGNEQDADDVVQEASLRAFRYFRTFTGGNGRAWFLRIVRNLCYGWRRASARSRFEAAADSFDEERHWSDWAECTPEALVLHADTAAVIEQALGTLPHRARELLVRREFEGLSYRELSDELHMPIGTVMSGLSRARQALRVALHDEMRRRSKHARRGSPEHEADAARLSRPHQPDAGLDDRTVRHVTARVQSC